ncbi:MAG: hypothetical protein Q9227_005748 [Pyrenula ochraceoflavens]
MTTKDERYASPEPESEQVAVEEKPYSIWSKKERRLIVLAASFASFFSPLASSIYFPALNSIAADLNVTVTKVNLTVTTYMIFQALSPTIIAGFSDNAGRRPAYVVCFLITIAANIALALQSNYAALLVLRCVQAAGSAGTVALAYSVVADCASSDERGQFVGWASISTMLGPSIAPILGGILSQYAGWHWIFWFTVILAFVLGLPILLFLPETCRRIVDNGSIPPPKTNMSVIDCFQQRKQRHSNCRDHGVDRPKPNIRFPNPLATLILMGNLEAFLVLIGTALPAACLYAVLTGIPSIFSDTYHLSTVIIGLVYLPFGAGSFCAALVIGKFIDWSYRRHAKRLGFPVVRNKATDLRDFPLELARLEQAIPVQIATGVVIIAYGWAIDANAHLSVPLILLAIDGFLSIGLFQLTTVLLIDIHPKQPATASAASNLIRGLLGAGAAAVVGPMLDSKLGRGGTYTVVGGILIMFCPVFWILIKYGPGWRKKKAEKEEEEEQRQRAQDPARENTTITQEKQDLGIVSNEGKKDRPMPHEGDAASSTLSKDNEKSEASSSAA